MTPQPPDLKKLREVAERATPGPWEYRENDGVAAVAHPKGWVEAVMPCGDQENKDAEFIATFNPQTILALLDAYEASARDADQFVKVPADKFALMRKALHRSAPIPEVIRTFPESRKEHEQIYAFAEELERMHAARHATQGD